MKIAIDTQTTLGQKSGFDFYFPQRKKIRVWKGIL